MAHESDPGDRPSAGGKRDLVVEKILADRERLPRFAGIAGTTGYEWLNVISRLLVDDDGLASLDRIWRQVPGRKWHARQMGKTNSSNEVVLIHRAS